MKADVSTTQTGESEQPTPAPRSVSSRFTGRLRGRVPLLEAGMALNWNWLTAIGAAPIILSLALICTDGICCSEGDYQP